MSRSFLFFIVGISYLISITSAFCPPWQGGGTINVCKQRGKSNCLGVGSTNTCINLIGGPFVSGFTTGGGYSCTIYSGLACSGTSVSVNRSGWSSFPITPKSFRCPCV